MRVSTRTRCQRQYPESREVVYVKPFERRKVVQAALPQAMPAEWHHLGYVAELWKTLARPWHLKDSMAILTAQVQLGSPNQSPREPRGQNKRYLNHLASVTTCTKFGPQVSITEMAMEVL